jgi:amino acid permease
MASYKQDPQEVSCFGFHQDSVAAATPSFEFSGIAEMFPIIVFSTVFQQAIPSLAHEANDKTQLSSIFTKTISFCAFSYILIGTTGAWYFGPLVEQEINLNWSHYHCLTSWSSNAIKIFVLCFPAIDVISLYPLDAICLTSSLMGISKRGDDHRVKLIYSALSSIPPIIASLYIRNLGRILSYAGLTGILIAFCFPSILYITSEVQMKQLRIPHKTIYDTFGSSILSANVVFLFGIFSIVILFFITSFHHSN